jgi:hypothetical protein
MTPSHLAAALRNLVSKAATSELAPDERQRLEAHLDELLAQPVDVEEAVVAQVIDETFDTPGAGDFFLSEVEMQSELVFLGKKRDQAVLLFCLPVAFMAGDPVQQLARSTDDMEELTHVLTETDVVGAQARVALLPRLFHPHELVTQSYGRLRKLTQTLGAQLLAGDPIRLFPGILAEGLPASEHFAWGDNPYVDLRFLVGVVVAHESALDDVFPAVGPETTDADLHRLDAQVQADERDDAEARAEQGLAVTGPAAGIPRWNGEVAVPAPFEGQAAPGETPAGEYWEDAFLAVVDEVFSPMFGAQETVLPDDFHENLRRGLELWRQAGIQHQVREGFHEREGVHIHALAWCDETTGRYGWDLLLTGEDGTVRDQGPWEALLHEQPSRVRECLEQLCEAQGWTLDEVEPLEPEH